VAFWQAYQQLVNLHQPSALNVIVLFTDGIPNGFYGTFNKKTISDTRYDYNNTGTTTTYAASSCPSATYTGVISQWSGFAATGTTVGLYSPFGTASANHAASWVSMTSCNAASTHEKMRMDLAYIPDQDVNGNKTRNYGYDYITFSTSDSGLIGGDFQPGYPAQIRIDSPWVIGLATKNTLDHAAIRLRNRVLDSTIPVAVYVIGFGPSGVTSGDVPDDVLMRRIANDPDASNTIFVNDPNTPAGKYIRASNGQQISAAFDSIASEVLRLSH